MISIITPSFDQLDWLRLALASVADQKGVEVEHIVQDGGTLGIQEMFQSAQLARSSTLSHPLPRLFVEKDGGMYDAINRGLARARGEICAYLNCDEQYLPGALAKVAQFFATNPEVDVLFGDLILVNVEGEPKSYRRTVLPTRRHIRLAHLNTTTCATFFRRRLLDRGFYFDTNWKTIGDAAWVEKLLQHRIKMAILRQPLAVFTFTGANLGASDVSDRELTKWRGTISAEKKLWKNAVIVWHRIRKAFAGAYWPRNVEIDVYTRDSPEKRRRRMAKRVGFRWRN